MKTRILLTVILLITLTSCVDKMLGKRYVKSIKNSQRDFANCYEIDGLFEHYPKSISNKSVRFMEAWIPDDMSRYPEKTWKASLFLLLEMGQNPQEFYPDTFIYKTQYQKPNFVVDYCFKWYQFYDKQRVRNVEQPQAYPIPYFEEYDFGLGSERIKFITDKDFEWVSDKHNVPKDLEVFVIKSGYGDFWKLACESKRPETLGDWKNGYSCGVAISKEHNMALYWMMTW